MHLLAHRSISKAVEDWPMRPKTKRAGTNPPVGTGSVTFRSPTKVGRTGLSVPMLTSSATDVTTATLWDRITPAEVLLVRGQLKSGGY
ncbi:MAG: hypothetical protein ACJAQ9_001184 [Ilumatobacter sp.]|jgi:hypothetical protein